MSSEHDSLTSRHKITLDRFTCHKKQTFYPKFVNSLIEELTLSSKQNMEF